MKNIFIYCFILMSVASSYAQLTLDRENIHKKNDIMVSLLLGRGQFASPVFAPSTNTGIINNETPNTQILSSNDNSFFNMIGAEVRYFLNSRIGLKFAGGAIINNTPAQENLAGVDGLVPEIVAVSADERIDLNFTLGAEYHFTTKSKRLSPYGGLAIPMVFGKHSRNNPNATDPASDEIFGTRKAVVLGIGGQAYAGVDYFFNKDIYIGVQINIVGSTYTRIDKSSGDGFDLSKSNSTQINALTQPVIKLGFKL